MFAIYKKELRSFFVTPLGYIFCAVFLAVSGFIFSVATVYSGTVDISGYFGIMIFGYIVLVPIITMKSFAEERRTRTDQLLLTAPVSISHVVLSKFFAAYTVFAGCLAASLVGFIPLSAYGEISVPRSVGCIIAMLLLGLAFCAVGIFVSSVTESQVTAAVGTMALLLVFVCASLFNGLIDAYPVRAVLSWLSVYSRYSAFTYGVFDFSSLLYYISFTAVFLFLTVRVQERRRWA